MIENLQLQYNKSIYEESVSTVLNIEKNIKLDSFSDLESYIHNHFSNDGYVVVYLYYKVLIGKKEKNKLVFFNNETFETKHILRLRVFNYRAELMIWRRKESIFNMRLRIDDALDNSTKEIVINTRQIIWGTTLTHLNGGWSELSEKRGTKIVVPFDNLIINNQKNRLELWVRNYITYNEYGQAGYSDSRFVKFMNRGENIGIA